jgi:hypothetical protein
MYSRKHIGAGPRARDRGAKARARDGRRDESARPIAATRSVPDARGIAARRARVASTRDLASTRDDLLLPSRSRRRRKT